MFFLILDVVASEHVTMHGRLYCHHSDYSFCYFLLCLPLFFCRSVRVVPPPPGFLSWFSFFARWVGGRPRALLLSSLWICPGLLSPGPLVYILLSPVQTQNLHTTNTSGTRCRSRRRVAPAAGSGASCPRGSRVLRWRRATRAIRTPSPPTRTTAARLATTTVESAVVGAKGTYALLWAVVQ